MGDGASLGDLELGQKLAGDKGVYVEWGMSEEEWGVWRQRLSPGSAIYCCAVLGKSVPLSEPQLSHP